jgi:hypothetical protein
MPLEKVPLVGVVALSCAALVGGWTFLNSPKNKDSKPYNSTSSEALLERAASYDKAAFENKRRAEVLANQALLGTKEHTPQ